MKSTIQKKEGLILGTIIFIAVLFKGMVSLFQYGVGWDEPNYLMLAKSFAEGHIGHGLHPYWSPMYPVCVALFSFVFRNIELSGRLVSLVAGTVILIPLYILSRSVFNRKIALWSVGLLAFYPPFAFLSTSAWTEPTYICFAIFGIYWGWQYLNHHRIINAVLAGLFFGFGYLTKPEGVGHFLVLFLIVLGQLLLNVKYRRHNALLLFLYTLSFFVVAFPYMDYLKQQTGQWTLSAKVQSNQQFEANAFSEQADQYDFDSLSSDNTQLPMDMIFHQGDFLNSINEGDGPQRNLGIGLLLTKYSTNLFKLWQEAIPNLFGFVLLMLSILGLFKQVWTKENFLLHLFLLSFILFYWMIVIPLFHINDRYLYPGFILSFIWMGKGLTEFQIWITKNLEILIAGFKRAVSPKIISYLGSGIAIFVVLLLTYIPEMGKIVKRDPASSYLYANAVELKRAGHWIQSHSNTTPVIMSYNKAVDFYAGCWDIRKCVSFSNNSIDRILAYAKYKKVDFIVLSNRYSPYFPNLDVLFSKWESFPELHLVYSESGTIELRIFKLLVE